ncbi:nucleotidyltransferase family protein [Primorskyibacter sp. S187A]|uniref:nucleotidyltransferase family protein n=1 Tax=Primorskyibacter sp. S187A TaxID=3415130 RepID=UPI003C7BCDF8
MSTCLILLAAGFGRRMRGADKHLERVQGHPVLRMLAMRGLEAGLEVIVTVPELTHPRAEVLRGLDVTRVPVPDAASGMAASFRAALAECSARDAMFLPGDMPDITTGDLSKIAGAEGMIVQATSEDGLPGHPVRFHESLFEELRQLQGDTGARTVLKRHSDHVTRIALPAHHAVTDLDTPEEWAAWRAGQATQ